MKISKKFPYVLISLGILYFSVSAYALFFGVEWITKAYINSLGERSVEMATIVSNKIKLTNADVDNLKSIKYRELENNKFNKMLLDDFSSEGISKNIRFIYLMAKLPEQEIKYTISQENTEFFDAPIGTKLDIIYLLDVEVNNNDFRTALDPAYLDDIYRYSVIREDEKNILTNKTPVFQKTTDEWGTQISGFVPLHTVEGTFVGMVGVDYSYGNILNYKILIFIILLLVLLVPSILLFLIFIYVYYNYLRLYQERSNIDYLTGLHNRQYFEKEFEKILDLCKKQKSSLAVMMIDIDYFKLHNDSYGHLIGDESLVKIAHTIKNIIKEYNGVLARYGGEEFVVVLSKVDTETINKINENILKKVRKLSIKRSLSHHETDELTVSIGIYLTVPGEERSAIELISKADELLYKSKSEGRNRCSIICDRGCK